MNKACFKCHETLPLSEFYRHPQMGDGHLNKCKRCTRRDVQDNYAERREQYLEYDRRRYRENTMKRRAQIEGGRDPMKMWARQATKSAVARGIITRTPCEVCGEEPTDAHHEDYTKPLEIRWLCRRHHMQQHRADAERREAA